MRRYRRLKSVRALWLSSPIATVLGALAMALLLAGCSEKPQDAAQKQAGTTVTRDTKAWNAEPTRFTVPGYRKGDQAAYDAALKQRTLMQNEYGRIGDSAK